MNKLKAQKRCRLKSELEQTLSPVNKIRKQIMDAAIPQIIVYQNGHIEYKYSEETEKLIAEADSLAEEITQTFVKKHNL